MLEPQCEGGILGTHVECPEQGAHLLSRGMHQVHTSHRSHSNVVTVKGIHIAAVYYGPIAMLIKVAILANWLRIFVPRGVHNALYWTLHALIWTNVVFYTITTFTEVFRCWPREKIWNPWYEGGRCTVDVLPQNIATGGLNFISDTIILAIPQWMIWRLNMSQKQKLGISLLFLIGIGYVASLLHVDRIQS